MELLDFRGIFQREWLPELFLNIFDLYLEAVREERVPELIKHGWDEMIMLCGKEPNDYPFEFSVDTCNYDDDTMFSIIEMPELPKAERRNLAIYAMVVFDVNNRTPQRFFLGETDYNGIHKRAIFVAEFEGNTHYNYGPLVCRDNIYKPVKREDELSEFIEHVMRVYKSE